MNIAAYCRVSTEKEDQLNSLEAQKAFFAEYTKRTGDCLVRLYADEGLSGTKIKNRREFLRMMEDAETGLFEMVVVKDISRFARNTVDLLQSIRRLRALGIETQFLTAGMTGMGNSEFVLTIFGALAQEESANTSRRVKFGKRLNAEKGRVPNIVYGYDKARDDCFQMSVNPEEAEVIRQIYRWYVHDGYGGARIGKLLNARGVKTKRGCDWSQNAVCRILSNELYTGRIINGRQEVADFLTGRRTDRPEEEWFITERPDLRIIEPELFRQARQIMRERSSAFRVDKARHSSRHLFSGLIRCADCGRSFRRLERTYRNTYVRWVCAGRNGMGADACPNAVTVDEEALTDALQARFADILRSERNVTGRFVSEAGRTYLAKDGRAGREKELTRQLARLRKSRRRVMDMYADELISREELNETLAGTRDELARLERELQLLSRRLPQSDVLARVLNDTFGTAESIADVRRMTNAQLRRIIDRIEVDHNGNADIFLRRLGDPGPARTVPECDDRT